MDGAFNEFCDAAVFGFDHDKLDKCNERASIQFDEFAESSLPTAASQQ
jgi:hypothetical protein